MKKDGPPVEGSDWRKIQVGRLFVCQVGRVGSPSEELISLQGRVK